MEYLLPTTATPYSTLTPAERSTIAAVQAEWRRIPADLPPRVGLERLAGSLDRAHYRRLADTDHDGLPDLLVAYDGDWGRPWDERLARMMLFRGADLVARRVRAHPLERSGLFPKFGIALGVISRFPTRIGQPAGLKLPRPVQNEEERPR